MDIYIAKNNNEINLNKKNSIINVAFENILINLKDLYGIIIIDEKSSNSGYICEYYWLQQLTKPIDLVFFNYKFFSPFYESNNDILGILNRKKLNLNSKYLQINKNKIFECIDNIIFNNNKELKKQIILKPQSSNFIISEVFEETHLIIQFNFLLMCMDINKKHKFKNYIKSKESELDEYIKNYLEN
jgi:hypothetical protein